MPDTSQAATPAGPARGRDRALALLCLLFAGRLVTAAILVPPWQNPDEPVHFAVIRAVTYKPWFDIGDRRNVDVQAEILRSMAEHDWWAAYSEPVPAPLPQSFEGVPTHMGDASLAPPLYYVAMAAYVRALRVTDLLSQYYAVRLASVAMTLLTFLVILRAAQVWFGARVALYTGVFVALVPQFALIGISVSPDPLLFLAAAVVWWQAGRLAWRTSIALPIVLMALATAVALLAKQLAIPLLLQVPALMLIAALSTDRGKVLVATVLWTVLMLRVSGVLRAATLLPPEPLVTLHRYSELLGWGDFVPPAGYFADFSWRLFETAYLVAGWQRFYAPAWIVGLALILFMVLAGRGVWWAALQRGDSRLKLAALAALAVVIVQLGAIYGTSYYRPGWGAQGRFLFPAIGPFAALCALGLVQWSPRLTSARVGLGLVTVCGLLDLASWMTTTVPVYGRWI